MRPNHLFLSASSVSGGEADDADKVQIKTAYLHQVKAHNINGLAYICADEAVKSLLSLKVD